MKKIMFFLFSVMILSSCVDYSGFDEPDKSSDYFLKANGTKMVGGDTIYIAINTLTSFEMLTPQGIKVEAVFRSSNLNSSFGTGLKADISYSNTGIYKVSASLIGSDKTISVYVSVQKSTDYTLKINGNSVAAGSTFNATTIQSLKFKVVDVDNKALTTAFDFGNGTKIKTDSVSLYYAEAGTYNVTATTGAKVIKLTIVITKGEKDALVVISATVSGNNINVTFGFKCSAIPNFSSTKPTYVAGELPNASWYKYDLSEVVSIGGVNYFKWSITTPPGKFRLSWIQQKDVKAAFNYDDCNWSYDSSSAFWNAKDYLYYIYLKIDNNAVIVSAS